MDAFMGEAQGWHSISFHALARLARSSHVNNRISDIWGDHGAATPHPLLHTLVRVLVQRLRYRGDARAHVARSWSHAERCLLFVRAWHSHWILFVELRPAATGRQTPRIHPRGPTTSTALTSHPAQFLRGAEWRPAQLARRLMTRMTTWTTRARPTQTPNVHRTPSHLAQFLGVSSRQPADYVLHKHNMEQNGTPHNSPIASTTGMTTLTTCEDDPHPLLASQRLSGVKPTSHEAPADDLMPRRR
ncbi:hypothetical protein DFH09DRAFT_1087569 [Mycena vulgaris]|nr:hypothetical protein DFH09DRAFT_1087569 [Mycena vulgaris]